MGIGLPLSVEVAFLALVLPIAFAYLFALAGVAAMAACVMMRNFASRLRHRQDDPSVSSH